MDPERETDGEQLPGLGTLLCQQGNNANAADGDPAPPV